MNAMRPDLDLALTTQFPQLFANRHLPPDISAMRRGFECGDGWFPLLTGLCQSLTEAVAREEMPVVIVNQVKEKLGRLRFRYSGGNEMTYGMVYLAESLSELINPSSGDWQTDWSN